MGYLIEYDKGMTKKRAIYRKKSGAGRILALALLLGTMLLPAGRTALRNLILPGNEEITAHALEALAEDLKAGDTVGEAVEAFCKEIIHGG